MSATVPPRCGSPGATTSCPHRAGGHPARLGQRPEARRRGAAHRRPGPAADAPLRGLPQPAQRRHRQNHRRAERRPGLGRGAGDGQVRDQPGEHHRLSGAPGGRQAGARHLRDGRPALRHGVVGRGRGLREPSDPVVRRLRPRPHRDQGPGRRSRRAALPQHGAGDGRGRYPPRRPQQRGAGRPQDRCAGPRRLRARPEPGGGRGGPEPRRGAERRRLQLPRPRPGCLRPDGPGGEGPPRGRGARRLSLHRARGLPLRRDGAGHGAPARCRWAAPSPTCP